MYLYSFRMHYLFNLNNEFIFGYTPNLYQQQKSKHSNSAKLWVCIGLVLTPHNHLFRASPAECHLRHCWSHLGTVLGRESAEFDDMLNCSHPDLDPIDINECKFLLFMFKSSPVISCQANNRWSLINHVTNRIMQLTWNTMFTKWNV